MPTNGPSIPAFGVLAAITLASAIGAMTLRNLVHCGLALALAFGGLAALYLQLSAEFVGLAQILVYVGAVAILIVFTILLTRNADVHLSRGSRGWVAGLFIAAAVCASIVVPVLKSPSFDRAPTLVPRLTVGKIGDQLMTNYVLPLEAIGLLLTASLLGGIVIAMRDEPAAKTTTTSQPVRRDGPRTAEAAPRFDTAAVESKP